MIGIDSHYKSTKESYLLEAFQDFNSSLRTEMKDSLDKAKEQNELRTTLINIQNSFDKKSSKLGKRILSLDNIINKFRIKYIAKKRLLISRFIYIIVIYKFFTLIREEIFKGYVFKFYPRIGQFSIVRIKDTRKLYTDFQATKLKRAELLKSGVKEKDLFSRAKFKALVEEYVNEGYSRELARVKAKDSGKCGIPYIVYHNLQDFFWLRMEYNTLHYKNLAPKYIFAMNQDLKKRCLVECKNNPDLFQLRSTRYGGL